MVSDMKNITRAEKVFIIVSFILLGLLALMIIVPMISVVINSFVSAAETARRGQFILWPEDWDFTAYKMLFNSDRIYSGYVNTLFVTFVGTGLSMLMTICTAYPLSKKDLRGRNGILAMIFFTMLFNAGIIPNFLLVKTIGLLDTRWALVLPYLLNTWNMLMMRNFFYAIPDALEEAAFLDGANQLQIIVKVVLPLSLPSIATISMFYAVAFWNAWFPGVMYLTNKNLQPVQNVMRSIIVAASGNLEDIGVSVDDVQVLPTSNTLKCASIVITTVPILVVYPFIQKYFVKGAMVGSVKG